MKRTNWKKEAEKWQSIAGAYKQSLKKELAIKAETAKKSFISVRKSSWWKFW